MQSGRDTSGVGNLLGASSNAEITSISFGPSISAPNVTATIHETQTVSILGTSTVQASKNVNLLAIPGQGGSDRAQTSGNCVNLSLIPYGFPVTGGATVTSSNVVTVAPTASVTAGVASTSVMKIMPLDLDGVAQKVPGSTTETVRSRLGTELSDAEKTILSLPVELRYVYAPIDLTHITLPITTGTLVKVIAGANQGGVCRECNPDATNGIAVPRTLTPVNR